MRICFIICPDKISPLEALHACTLPPSFPACSSTQINSKAAADTRNENASPADARNMV